MNKPPKNNKNPNKNLFFFIKDLSNNNPFLDSSSNTTINPLFSPLQSWNKNKNLLLLNDKDNSNNDFKTKKDDFTMRLDTIINKIREERNENKKNDKNENLFKLKTTLTNQQLLKDKDKKVLFNPKLSPKDAIDDLLLQITKKYDLASTNVPKNKTLVPKIKLPPPPPPGFGPESGSGSRPKNGVSFSVNRESSKTPSISPFTSKWVFCNGSWQIVSK